MAIESRARICIACNQTARFDGAAWVHTSPTLYGPAHEPTFEAAPAPARAKLPAFATADADGLSTYPLMLARNRAARLLHVAEEEAFGRPLCGRAANGAGYAIVEFLGRVADGAELEHPVCAWCRSIVDSAAGLEVIVIGGRPFRRAGVGDYQPADARELRARYCEAFASQREAEERLGAVKLPREVRS